MKINNGLDIKKIRDDFPILKEKVYNKAFIYFDNAATTQKPQQVINKINKLYSTTNSNIHRGVHYLSEQMTAAYEKSRFAIKEYINAKKEEEIIFTSGTTDAINTVAYSFGEKYINEKDEIIVSTLEHHSNIVPWQMLCKRKNAKLKVIPINDKGELLIDEYEKLISEKTKLVCICHASNSIGTINPINKITNIAHKYGAKVLIDGAQTIQHLKIDVQKTDCDFFVFSGHKVYAATGIGVLYGKEKLLNEMPPCKGGGDMIKSVSFEKTIYHNLPFKFEAGTTNYIAAISIAEALKYIQDLGIENIKNREDNLLKYATEKLEETDKLNIIGKSDKKTAIISFLADNIHPLDLGSVLDKMGIALRTGTHCAMPLMNRMRINGTVRASFAFYNTEEEIDIFIQALKRAVNMLS